MAEVLPFQVIKGILSQSGFVLTGVMGKSSVTVPSYEGEYEITPDQSEHIMLTKGKLMHNNMKIHEISYYEVSNLSGGITVTIGGD